MSRGVLYTTGNWSVGYALDARTGKLLWNTFPPTTHTRASWSGASTPCPPTTADYTAPADPAKGFKSAAWNARRRHDTSHDPFGHLWLLASKQEEVPYEQLAARLRKMMSSHALPYFAAPTNTNAMTQGVVLLLRQACRVPFCTTQSPCFRLTFAPSSSSKVISPEMTTP